MKLIGNLRRSLVSCFSTTATTTATTTTSSSSSATIKTRLSTSITNLFKDHKETPGQETQEEHDTLIDPAHPSSPSKSTVVGTIYGHRRGHVSFCLQSDPTTPPPFLLELSMPTHLLAKEMEAGLLRIAFECHRDPSSAARSLHSAPMWQAYCNGRKVGYAVRRRPTDKDRLILSTVRSTSAGAGVLFPGEMGRDGKEEGELIYMRASYERVVGSCDSESYHLINPGGSPDQEFSFFLLRTG